MILIAASVLISLWRKSMNDLTPALLHADVAICGVTKAELLHGARSEREMETILNALSGFRYVPTPEGVWEILGRHLALLKSRGLTVPLADSLISTLAIVADLELWTLDGHFSLIQRELPQLRLYPTTRS